MEPPEKPTPVPASKRTGCSPRLSGNGLRNRLKLGHLSKPLIFSASTSVPTALRGTPPKASHREYRPKREPERANVGMEWMRLGTLEPAGGPPNSGLQIEKSRLQRNVILVNSRSPRASTSTFG